MSFDEQFQRVTLTLVAASIAFLFCLFIKSAWNDYHRKFMNHLNVVMDCRKTVDVSKADHICGPIPTWENYNNK